MTKSKGDKPIKNPSKFNDVMKDKLLDMIIEGVRPSQAMKALGLSMSVYYDHYNTDPDFAAMVDQAEEHATDIIENSLWQRAKEGNVEAIKEWLHNRRSNKWTDSKNIKVSGDKDAPLKIELSLQEKMKAYEKHFAELDSETESNNSSDDTGQ
jgi:hypothetical protein